MNRNPEVSVKGWIVEKSIFVVYSKITVFELVRVPKPMESRCEDAAGSTSEFVKEKVNEIVPNRRRIKISVKCWKPFGIIFHIFS